MHYRSLHVQGFHNKDACVEVATCFPRSAAMAELSRLAGPPINTPEKFTKKRYIRHYVTCKVE